MKKILSSILMLAIAGSGVVFGQTAKEAENMIIIQQYAKAKEAIDKAMANEKQKVKPETWYVKAKVYGMIPNDEKLKAANPNYIDEAFSALKTYMEMEPAFTKMKEDQNYVPFIVYQDWVNAALAKYQAQKYGEALTEMNKVAVISDMIRKNNLSYGTISLPDLDTTVVLISGFSAYFEKDMPKAIEYFNQFFNARVGGEDYLDIYKIALNYYLENGQMDKFENLMAISRQVYPEQMDLWLAFDEEVINKIEDKAEQIKAYKKLFATYPDNYFVGYNYAVFIYNEIYAADTKPANVNELKAELISVGNKIIAIEPNNTLGTMLLVRHFYYDMNDFMDQYRATRGATPADQKKREDLRNKAKEIGSMAIPVAEMLIKQYAAMDQKGFKMMEKLNYKSVAEYLSEIYRVKEDLTKAKEYDKMVETINAMETIK